MLHEATVQRAAYFGCQNRANMASVFEELVLWEFLVVCVCLGLGFPGGSNGKESACNAGDLSSISGSGRSPGEGHGNPLQYSCLEKSHEHRSPAGCNPWGHKESDTIKRRILSLTLNTVWEGRKFPRKCRSCKYYLFIFGCAASSFLCAGFL